MSEPPNRDKRNKFIGFYCTEREFEVWHSMTENLSKTIRMLLAGLAAERLGGKRKKGKQ